MRAIVLGGTTFSERLLECLLEHRVTVDAVFAIPEVFRVPFSAEPVRNYNYADLSAVARRHGIPCREVDGAPGRRLSDHLPLIASLQPDVVLVLGWYYLVPAAVRAIPRCGAWGIHASLLPDYAGHAPLVWAMIHGEPETGVTLFRLDKGVDDGDIIAQRKFPIHFTDTIREVYERATECSKEMLIGALTDFDERRLQPQDKQRIRRYPPRSPADGALDLSKPSRELYDFIRAQTRPYPGAFATVDGRRLTLWDVRWHALTSEDEPHRANECFERAGDLYLRLADGLIQVLCADYDGERDLCGPELCTRLAGRRLLG